MRTEVAVLNFKRKKGKLYYVNSEGNLVEMDPPTKEKIVVSEPKIEKLKGYFYFLNKQGNISQVKMKNQKNPIKINN